MKLKIYNFLVNRKKGITIRYRRFRDGAIGFKRAVSWLYLLWLNFAYYILFMKFLGKDPSINVYEEKKNNLLTQCSESNDFTNNFPNLTIEGFLEKLNPYDLISFDIFDTLIFRTVAQPTDAFHIIGEKLQILDFKNIRRNVELDTRNKSKATKGHTEIKLSDIWNNLESTLGCDANLGIQTEIEMEKTVCYANPFMLEVWNRLIELKKEIIIVSDMYLPSKILEEILNKNGFTGFKKLYVSCEYKKNKASGTLFELVKSDHPGKSIIHIGDNPHSDYEMAKKHGLATLSYPNINKNMKLYRAFDMSSLIGSTYRALVSAGLYNGLNKFSIDYEYGYIYGGLFVLGYCSFIHKYCKQNSIDKILFLSRDGDVLKQAYDYLYPDENTEYVYWSRKASTKLETDFNKQDFFRRFVYHKVNQSYSIFEVLKAMELDTLIMGSDALIIDLKDNEKSYNIDTALKLKLEDKLTDKNAESLVRYLESIWNDIKKLYSNQDAAAKIYYEDVLKGCDKAVAVDIGWAGSGAITLDYLVRKTWNIPCDIMGIIAGTNTVHNAEPDASEAFLQSGKLVAYLYSQSHNRDLLKKHDPNKNYNVYWELLLSSPTPQFAGFYTGDCRRDGLDDKYLEDLDITLRFGKYDKNQEGIKEIQRGILDFVHQYKEHWGDPVKGEYSYMYNISGRDAYAPMLVAASHNEMYLKMIEKRFNLEVNVD